MATNTTAELGSKENPYSEQDYAQMKKDGTWTGGHVLMANGEVVYCFADLVVNGYSSSASGSSVSVSGSKEGKGSSKNNGGSPDEPVFPDPDEPPVDPDAPIDPEIPDTPDEPEDPDNPENPEHSGSENSEGTTAGHSGGGHHGDNNSTSVQERVQVVTRQALSFSKKKEEIISQLFEDGKINAVNETPHGTDACYDQEKKHIAITPGSGPQGICHEMVHLFQDNLGMMKDKVVSDPNSDPPFVSCATDNEFQAEFFTVLIHNIKFNNKETPYKFGLSSNEWAELNKKIDNNKSVDAQYQIKWIKYSFVEYLDSLNYTSWLDHYKKYYEGEYPDPNQFKTYKQPHDPDYQWRWEDIFNAFGIKIKE